MTRSMFRTIALAAAGTVLAGAAVQGQDWPQWRGPNRDGKVAGFAAPEKWPGALAKKWSVDVGQGCATPALVGDRLYVFARQGNEEVILCLQASDGKEVWKDRYEAPKVGGPASGHPGPRSSPAVAEGKVVTLGVGGHVSCLDASTGKLLWRNTEYTKAVPGFFTSASPLIAGGAAILHLGGKDAGAVVAFDLAAGSEKWKWAGDAPAYASPALVEVEGTKMAVVQGTKCLTGLALADGKLLWQVPTPIQGRSQNAASPVVDGTLVIFTGQGSGTKAVKVEKAGDGFAAKEAWSNPDVGTTFNTPVAKDGFLYGTSDGSNFFCLEEATGKTAWKDGTKRDRFCATLDAGTVLLALAPNSTLVAYKPSGKGYEEVASIKISETATYAHPVVSGKRIFLKDKDSVALLVIE